MLRTLLCVAAIVALAVSPALSSTAHKDGTPVQPTEPRDGNLSELRTDWEWSTAGMNFIPDLGGSATGWAEWFITTVHYTGDQCLQLIEFGFPVCGPTTGTYGWLVWGDVGYLGPPPGGANTADYYGQFTPVCTDPNMFPPTIYTYVDVSSAGVMVLPGSYICFGYDNTGMGGMTYFNGVDTWGWYGGYWDSDQGWGRTAVMQVKGNFAGSTAIEGSTWGAIKSLLR